MRVLIPGDVRVLKNYKGQANSSALQGVACFLQFFTKFLRLGATTHPAATVGRHRPGMAVDKRTDLSTLDNLCTPATFAGTA